MVWPSAPSRRGCTEPCTSMVCTHLTCSPVRPSRELHSLSLPCGSFSLQAVLLVGEPVQGIKSRTLLGITSHLGFKSAPALSVFRISQRARQAPRLHMRHCLVHPFFPWELSSMGTLLPQWPTAGNFSLAASSQSSALRSLYFSPLRLPRLLQGKHLGLLSSIPFPFSACHLTSARTSSVPVLTRHPEAKHCSCFGPSTFHQHTLSPGRPQL